MNSKLFYGIVLVISNLALLPAIIYSYRNRLFPEFSFLVISFVASVLYHLCLHEFFCIMLLDLWILRVQDHFFVYATFSWLVLFCSGMDLEFRIPTFAWTLLLLYPMVLAFIDEWWFLVLFIGVVMTIYLCAIFFFSRKLPRIRLEYVFAIGLLTAIGTFLNVYSGNPTTISDSDEDARYAVTHSIWHVLGMGAVYFVCKFGHEESGKFPIDNILPLIKEKKQAKMRNRKSSRRNGGTLLTLSRETLRNAQKLMG